MKLLRLKLVYFTMVTLLPFFIVFGYIRSLMTPELTDTLLVFNRFKFPAMLLTVWVGLFLVVMGSIIFYALLRPVLNANSGPSFFKSRS